ncbi:hypothetical protein [Streptomyces roseolilacinus]|uniref:hypothetical protein n=1 Tax=Streptomyces roseolilacinus TaxID=66904 RepID=UPI003805217F
MTVREDLRLTGADTDTYAAARAESHATRAAVEAPHVLVAILAPALAPAADAAARAAYALRGAADPTALAALREDAITAARALTSAAARTFA